MAVPSFLPLLFLFLFSVSLKLPANHNSPPPPGHKISCNHRNTITKLTASLLSINKHFHSPPQFLCNRIQTPQASSPNHPSLQFPEIPIHSSLQLTNPLSIKPSSSFSLDFSFAGLETRSFSARSTSTKQPSCRLPAHHSVSAAAVPASTPQSIDLLTTSSVSPSPKLTAMPRVVLCRHKPSSGVSNPAIPTLPVSAASPCAQPSHHRSQTSRRRPLLPLLPSSHHRRLIVAALIALPQSQSDLPSTVPSSSHGLSPSAAKKEKARRMKKSCTGLMNEE